MPPIILVMLGGAVGAAMRYLFGLAAFRIGGPGFPWGTLGVNLVGALLMGVLAATLARSVQAGSEQLRLLLGVGVLGGFTTFSSFSLDTLLLWDRGQVMTASAYVLVSVAGSLACLALGRTLVRVVA